jgi:hypothetical protein
MKTLVWARLLLLGLIALWWLLPGEASAAATVTGTVYQDRNRNLCLDQGEPGIPGVCVSNGLQVTRTDSRGRYSLPVMEPMHVFVIKPAGFAWPLNANNLPLFSYLHHPEGSPSSIQRFQGIAPTGELPEEIDFPLFPSEDPKTFSLLVIGDTQVKDHEQLSFVRDSFVNRALGTEAHLALALGDLVDDDLSLYPRYLQLMRLLGIPFLAVPGNHDLDRDAQQDKSSLDTFQSTFGPPFYAANIGRVHLVVLDNVTWDGSGYRAELGRQQLKWLKNDLARVPEDRLIVLAMHIPVVSWIDRERPRQMLAEREELSSLLKGREVLALAGHTHTVEHLRPGEEFGRWGAPLPFPQIVCGAVCGSWWTGPPDNLGIPLSMQREGAPRGYGMLHVQGTDYSWSYRALGGDSDHQMHVSLLSPTTTQPHPTGVVFLSGPGNPRVVANVFRGSRDMEVSCRVDDGPWLTMERSFTTPDPFAFRTTSSLKPWLQPRASSHVWTIGLPDGLSLGAHTVEVRATDVFGRTSEDFLVFEIGPASDRAHMKLNP